MISPFRFFSTWFWAVVLLILALVVVVAVAAIYVWCPVDGRSAVSACLVAAGGLTAAGSVFGGYTHGR